MSKKKHKLPSHFRLAPTCWDCLFCKVVFDEGGPIQGRYSCNRYKVILSDYEAENYVCDEFEQQ